MNIAINYLEEKFAADTIKIQAQEYLHAFYGSLGFEQISKPYLDDGILHIDMLRGKIGPKKSARGYGWSR